MNKLQGKIISTKLKVIEKKNYTGEVFKSHKVGYVAFEDVKKAQKCIQVYDHTHLFGVGGKPLIVDFWISDYDRKKMQEENENNTTKTLIQEVK